MGSFKHKKLFDFKKLPYKTVDGRRMYESPSGIQLPSITSILGWFKKEGIKEWRERVGEEEANKISEGSHLSFWIWDHGVPKTKCIYFMTF